MNMGSEELFIKKESVLLCSNAAKRLED